LAPEALCDEERARILKAFRRGLPIDRVAHRVRRPRSTVYRVIVEERIARLNRRKVRFIDDPIYRDPEAERQVDELVTNQDLSASPAKEEQRVPRDLPPYLQDLYRTPLLTPAKERALFLKFNFHKHQFVTARRKLEPQFARARELNELEDHLRKAIDTKNAIVRANLRLVVNIARKHLRPGLNLMELVSDGNMTLLRAVESFDVHRGFRFSTYATLALMKGFARSVPMMRASAGLGTATASEDRRLAEVPDRASEPFTRQILLRDEVQRLLSRLSHREREIVQAHYGLDGGANRFESSGPASLDELSVRFGLTKARIRQIEQAAMEKLRAASTSASPVAMA
jgi:RNA polymerase sigma factor (sigma-70 family)